MDGQDDRIDRVRSEEGVEWGVLMVDGQNSECGVEKARFWSKTPMNLKNASKRVRTADLARKH
jgi:hypothetical protein